MVQTEQCPSPFGDHSYQSMGSRQRPILPGEGREEGEERGEEGERGEGREGGPQVITVHNVSKGLYLG